MKQYPLKEKKKIYQSRLKIIKVLKVFLWLCPIVTTLLIILLTIYKYKFDELYYYIASLLISYLICLNVFIYDTKIIQGLHDSLETTKEVQSNR